MNGKDIFIVDTTLRDGEQMPGMVFSPRQKGRWAKEIAAAGVSEIEAVTPAMGRVEREAFGHISDALEQHDLKANIYSWNRLRLEDIESSLQWGVKHLFISAPVSARQLSHMLKLSRDELAERFENYVALAVREGAGVVCGFMDIPYAEEEFAAELLQRVAGAGAKRVRLSDTNGTLTPLKTHRLVSRLSGLNSLPLEFHAHNDFGLASANTLAAAEAGARYVDTTTLGIGERAGNARTEEVVMALEQLVGMKTGVDIKKMSTLARKFAMVHGIAISSNRPVLGEKIFHHESGIHVAGIEKEPAFFEPWPSELTGNERKIVLGKHSGMKAISLFCRNHHLPLDHLSQEEALAEVRRLAREKGASLNEPEAMEVLRAFCL